MKSKSNTYPLYKRLLCGVAASFILGIPIGTLIAVWKIHTNSIDSLYIKGMLGLHLAALSSLIYIIPGLLLGAFVFGRRKDMGMLANGIILLGAILSFFYGRNLLCLKIMDYFEGPRLIVDIIITLGWAFCCILLYKLLIVFEKHLRGWIVRISLLVVICLLGWHSFSIIKPPINKPQGTITGHSVVPNEDVKVAILGLDGAWWEFIDPMMEEGKLPNFKQLVDDGVRAPLQTFIPTRSPAIWTTIATGKMPAKHHIISFNISKFPITGVIVPISGLPRLFPEMNYLFGRIIKRMPIGSYLRNSEAIWNVLSYSDLSVGIINWWTTYPAEKINGYMITSKAYEQILRFSKSENPTVDSSSVYPTSLFHQMIPLIIDPMNMPADSIARFVQFRASYEWNEYQQIQEVQLSKCARDLSMFKFYYPYDESIVRMTSYLSKTFEQPNFLAVYLRGLDTIQHWYLSYYYHHHQSKYPNIPNPKITHLVKDLVPDYYMYMDQVLGKFLKLLDPNTVVIVVSDHGFDHGLAREGIFHHYNAPPGVFIVAGENIKRGETIHNASVQDITPTVLALFGLPVGRDMDGRVLTEIFEEDTVSITWVDTYETGRRARTTASPQELDNQTLEQLKALGYVK